MIESLTGAGIALVSALLSGLCVHKLDEVRSKREYVRSKTKETYEALINYKEILFLRIINKETQGMTADEDNERILFGRVKRYIFFDNRELIDHFKKMEQNRIDFFEGKKNFWDTHELKMLFEEMEKKLEDKYKKYI